MQLALRESPIGLWQQLFGLLAAIAVLAWLGPFNTWGWLSLPDRIAFWTLATGVNWLFGLVVGIASGLALERRGRLAWAAVVAGGSAVAALPGTAVVWLLAAAYVGYRMTGLAEIALLYSQVITIHLVLNALVTWLIVRQPRKAETETEGERDSLRPGPATPGPSFLERIPDRLGRNLLHLHMQDHYVEVHTDEGSDLLLLRFRDALREVEGLDGAQVHRSHWIARAALDRVERRNGRIVLRLVNGREVPVSRSFAPRLRERDWPLVPLQNGPVAAVQDSARPPALSGRGEGGRIHTLSGPSEPAARAKPTPRMVIPEITYSSGSERAADPKGGTST